MRSAAKDRVFRQARRMVAMEKVNDFINDYRSFFHRQRMGYYDDRLIFIHRWLVADARQYYANRK